VLLLLDYWPLERIRWKQQDSEAGKLSAMRIIAEKIPLFAIAAGSSAVTFAVQQSSGAAKMIKYYPMSIRLQNAVVSYTGYIFKMFYPTRLAVFYPHPRAALPLWELIVSFMILAFVSAVIIYLARRRPYLATGWLWYLGTLIPVIGLVQVGDQAMADRYTYIPLIGIFIIIAWGITELVFGWHYKKLLLGVLTSAILIALLLCTRKQVTYWKDSVTLFEHTLEVTENNYSIHNNYACTLAIMGRNKEAVFHFEEALRINPTHANALENLGINYYQQGKIKQAVDCWSRLLKFKPNNADILGNLAFIKATQKDPNFSNPEEAVKLAMRACKLTNYSRADLLDILAAACTAAGKLSEAANAAEKAKTLRAD